MRMVDELRRVAAKTEEANGRCGKLYRGDLDRIADAIEAELADHYVELPVDADGEHIHVGDVMEFSKFEIEHPVTRTVGGIGQGTFFAWCGERGYQQHDPKRYRHHRPPTVEDVLREFADLVRKERIELATISEDTIAEYAKRLRLAGEDE